jgi:hypothetical protein
LGIEKNTKIKKRILFTVKPVIEASVQSGANKPNRSFNRIFQFLIRPVLTSQEFFIEFVVILETPDITFRKSTLVPPLKIIPSNFLHKFLSRPSLRRKLDKY